MKSGLRNLPHSSKFFLLIGFIVLIHAKALGQIDSLTEIYDLRNGWMENVNEEFRIIEGNAMNHNVIHFYLTDNKDEKTNVLLKLPGQTSIWLDNKIWEYFEEDTLLIVPIDQMLDANQSKLISIYGKNLGNANLQTKIVTFDSYQTRALFTREQNTFKNYLLLSFFMGLLLLAVFKLSSSSNVQDYFMIGRLFNPRSRDEVMFKGKLFSAPNPLFYLVTSFLASQLAVSLITLTPNSFNINSGGNPITIGDMLILQSGVLLVIYLWIIIKWIIVRFVSGLFRLLDFAPVHFFNYQRFSFLFLIAFSAIVFLLYFGAGTNESIYSFLVWILVIIAALRMLLILFKLLNGSSYRILHLFSYLCATEIIPYLFAIKLILI